MGKVHRAHGGACARPRVNAGRAVVRWRADGGPGAPIRLGELAPSRSDGGATDPLLPLVGRRPDRVRGPRLWSAAGRRVVLAQPSAARLAEPGVAALPRRS